MKNWKTKNGYEIYRVLAGRSNCYLVSNGKHNILIDTGIGSAFKKLYQNIESLKLSNKKISFLILTHTHFDHCQNAKRIKEFENCRVIISEKEKESVEKGYTTLPNGTVPLTKLIAALGKKIGERKFGYEKFFPDILVQESIDLIKYGLDIKVVATPGHSQGSISVIIDNEIALVGDTLFGIYINSVFPSYAEDPIEMIMSWGKLLDTSCRIFLPGHGRAIKRELLQKEFERYTKRYNIQ